MPKTKPPIEVIPPDPNLDVPTKDGSDMFDDISREIVKLERFLRKREVDSKMCQPLHRMRWGLSDLKKHYEAQQTVCDKETKFDEYMKKGIDIPE